MLKDQVKWLLQGDPSIFYLTNKYLMGSDPLDLMMIQEQIPLNGWALDFFSYRNKETGLWGDGLYSPKWISTTYTLWELRNMEVPRDHPDYVESASILLEGLWHLPLKKKEKPLDHCICGMLLHICAYADIQSPKLSEIIDYLIETHMEDGGWNCRLWESPHHSSLHTTINVLEGIQTYLQYGYTYQKETLLKLRNQAHEFILCHHLYQSDKTGETIDKKMLMLSYPSRWRYDILRCMVYFADVGLAYDPRMAEALALIMKKRRKDGHWPVQQKYTGLVYFDMEKTGGPSRWNTLRVLRVLKAYGGYIEYK